MRDDTTSRRREPREQRVMPLNGGEQRESVRVDCRASVDLQPGFRAHLDLEDARTCMLIA
jgi:hypothetical protein